MTQCPECQSQRLFKDGVRKTNSGDVQRYLCRDCGFRFSENGGDKSFNMTSGTGSSCQIGAIARNAHGQVINLAAIEPLREGPAGATEKSLDTKGKIVEYAWWLKKDGKSDSTIEGRVKLLQVLSKRGANFYDPETVKEVIVKQLWSNGRKNNACDAYTSFLKMVGGKWEAPLYQTIRKLPFIPKETEIDQLIAGSSKKMATFLQTLKETGVRCGEIWQLNWEDIDFESKIVNITAEKNSNPRVVHLSNKLLEMLEKLPKILRRQIIFLPQNVSRPLRNRPQPPTKTPRKQTSKSQTTKDPFPYFQVLERNNALP